MIAGRVAAGTWRVPEALAGFSLDLLTDGAPGQYRLNGSPLSGEADRLRLCGPCRKGRKLELRVRATDEWTREPRVRIAEEGFPAAAGRPGAPPAAEWLRALGKDENRRYLELSNRYADSGSTAPSTSEGGASVPPSSSPLPAGRDSSGGG